MKKRQRIMVVDDSREMLKILERLLDLEGFDVVTAEDGSSALSILDEIIPDLVILDIMMPGLDGYQTLDLLRERSSVPVIMLTAKREVASLQKALLLGADDYVTKPFRSQSLVARIRSKLRRAQLANAVGEEAKI